MARKVGAQCARAHRRKFCCVGSSVVISLLYLITFRCLSIVIIPESLLKDFDRYDDIRVSDTMVFLL